MPEVEELYTRTIRLMSPQARLRLASLILKELAEDGASLVPAGSEATPAAKSLRGLWRGLDITEEDIAEARRETWSDFPREDI